MTDNITIPRATVQQALEALIESARLLGSTQAGKRFGCYSREDARLELTLYESIARHEASIIAALEQPEQEPARQRFDDTGGREEPDPVERLRFFCSLAMNKQDWLDVEAFFDDVLAERQKNAALEQLEPVARVIDNGTPEGSTEWIPYSVRQGLVKTGDLLYTHPPRREWQGLSEQEPELRELLIGAAAMAVAAERKGAYQGASWVADAVLEQPEQEAWSDARLRGIASDYFPDAKDWPAAMLCLRHLLMEQAKYPPASARVPLTEQPMQEPDRWGAGYEAGYAAGMAEMKQEQADPVAVFDEQQGSPVLLASAPMLSDGQPLYTRQPRREWRSLSEKEIGDVFHAARNAKLGAANDNSRHRLSVVEIARAVEAALKELNHD
jgi:hypothetical protein